MAKLLEFEAALAPSLVRPRAASSPAERDRASIGVGIIGAGAISEAHAAAYRSAGRRASLVGIADYDRARALEIQRKFGVVQAFSDYHELLDRDDIDVVSVCTPPSTHAVIVLDAIRAKKHVLCEKPITTTLSDAAAVIDAGLAHPDVVVSCVFQHRNDPALARAHWLLQQGVLGPLHAARVTVHAHRTSAHYVRGRGLRAVSGGGVLMEVGIHLLDALIWLLGDVESASATTQTAVHDIETEDTAAGWVRLKSGLIATFDCASWGRHDLYAFEVHGEGTTLTLRYRPGLARRWKLSVHSRSSRAFRRSLRQARRHFPSRGSRGADMALFAVARMTGSPRVPRRLRHGPQISRFLESVENKSVCPVSPAEARRSLELALAIYSSAATGQVVTLPLPAPNRQA